MNEKELMRRLQQANIGAAQRQSVEQQQKMLRMQQEEMIQRQRDEFIRQFIANMSRDLYIEKIKHCGDSDEACRLALIDECQQRALEFAERLGMIQRQPKQENEQ